MTLGAGADDPVAALLEALPDAVLVVDAQGAVALANARARALLGADGEAVAGRPVSDLLQAPESLAFDPWAPGDAGADRPLRRLELSVRCVRSRGGGFPVEAVLTPASLGGDGDVVVVTLRERELGEPDAAERLAAVARDMTERTLIEEELRRSNRDLEQFAYVASHDLSEPLRVIAGFVDLLARRYRGRLDEDADRFIDFIVTGVERMQRLIDDLLLYSRAGRAQVERTPVDVGEVVRDVLWALGPQLRDREVEVDVAELPTVLAERAMLRQIFANLISNAIKFGDPGRPHVSIRAVHEPGAWRFDVQDNGSGIEPRYAERVFEMFQRLHGREVPGSGIGLAIVKRLTERLGGHVTVGPAKPKGSIFTVTIPDRDRPPR